MQICDILHVSVSEIGNTISNLFGGGKTEGTSQASSEPAAEDTASEVLLCV